MQRIVETGNVDMQMTGTAFERVAGEPRPEQDAQATLLSRLFSVFAGRRAKLIIPYVILTLLIASVGVYVITRLVTSSVVERFNNKLLESSRVAGDGIVRQERPP